MQTPVQSRSVPVVIASPGRDPYRDARLFRVFGFLLITLGILAFVLAGVMDDYFDARNVTFYVLVLLCGSFVLSTSTTRSSCPPGAALVCLILMLAVGVPFIVDIVNDTKNTDVSDDTSEDGSNDVSTYTYVFLVVVSLTELLGIFLGFLTCRRFYTTDSRRRTVVTHEMQYIANNIRTRPPGNSNFNFVDAPPAYETLQVVPPVVSGGPPVVPGGPPVVPGYPPVVPSTSLPPPSRLVGYSWLDSTPPIEPHAPSRTTVLEMDTVSVSSVPALIDFSDSPTELGPPVHPETRNSLSMLAVSAESASPDAGAQSNLQSLASDGAMPPEWDLSFLDDQPKPEAQLQNPNAPEPHTSQYVSDLASFEGVRGLSAIPTIPTGTTRSVPLPDFSAFTNGPTASSVVNISSISGTTVHFSFDPASSSINTLTLEEDVCSQ